MPTLQLIAVFTINKIVFESSQALLEGHGYESSQHIRQIYRYHYYQKHKYDKPEKYLQTA